MVYTSRSLWHRRRESEHFSLVLGGACGGELGEIWLGLLLRSTHSKSSPKLTESEYYAQCFAHAMLLDCLHMGQVNSVQLWGASSLPRFLCFLCTEVLGQAQPCLIWIHTHTHTMWDKWQTITLVVEGAVAWQGQEGEGHPPPSHKWKHCCECAQLQRRLWLFLSPHSSTDVLTDHPDLSRIFS